MICRGALKQLQGPTEYPSVSLLAPTHRTAPANQKDRVVVKNLMAEGLVRLHGEFKSRDVAPLVRNLGQLVDDVDWEHGGSMDLPSSPTMRSRRRSGSPSASGRGSSSMQRSRRVTSSSPSTGPRTTVSSS